MNENAGEVMSIDGSRFERGGPACAFCTAVLSDDDSVALMTMRSHAHGQRYFGAHARCLQAAMRPEIRQFFELDDVPVGGLHTLLPRPAKS